MQRRSYGFPCRYVHAHTDSHTDSGPHVHAHTDSYTVADRYVHAHTDLDVGARVGVGVGVSVDVAVGDRVGVGVSVAMRAGVGVGVGVSVDVAVGDRVGVGVSVAMRGGVGVGVGVSVDVVVGDRVGVGVSATPSPVSLNPVSDEVLVRGLFSEVEGNAPSGTGVETLASRLVGIDFEQIAQVTSPVVGPKDSASAAPPILVLNLFDDVTFAGIVEHLEPTSSGHALQGRLDGVKFGTFTLVINGSVVSGTVRSPEAVYTIRTVSNGKYVIRQIDESSLPPEGEPLQGHPSTPNTELPSPFARTRCDRSGCPGPHGHTRADFHTDADPHA